MTIGSGEGTPMDFGVSVWPRMYGISQQVGVKRQETESSRSEDTHCGGHWELWMNMAPWCKIRIRGTRSLVYERQDGRGQPTSQGKLIMFVFIMGKESRFGQGSGVPEGVLGPPLFGVLPHATRRKYWPETHVWRDIVREEMLEETEREREKDTRVRDTYLRLKWWGRMRKRI